MYGRLVEIEGMDPSRRAEAEQNLRERVIPALKGKDGFRGFISMADAENRRARGVLLWETRESAEDAERELAPMRDEMMSGMGATVRSTDLYEVLVAELPGTASV